MSKILFLSNDFITLYRYRKELIAKLCEMGHDVYVSTSVDERNCFFEEVGCTLIETEMERRGTNPVADLKLIRQYKKIMKEVKPDIIFSYTIKPNIYGTLASNALGYKQVCNITGTGATFLKENALSKLCRMLYKISVKKSYKVFFQNTGDRDYFIQHGMIADNYEMLPGSGCNLVEHSYSDIPQEEVVRFLFIGRVMEVKGINEYLVCARHLKEKYPNTEFAIAGWIEEDKYEDVIRFHHEEGIINYLGFQKNIADWIRKSSCVVLPSRGGEGVPNVLLEASAMGRPCVASRINGSKDVVEDGVTGYLFEPGNSEDLILKAEHFLKTSYEEKQSMGKHGREKVEKEFNRQIVIEKYIDEVTKA